MNVVILTGRLTADPELRYTQQGTPCTSFNLAVDRASKDDTADFPTIVAWDKTAEFLQKYMSKGSKIVVRGEIRTRNYNDNDGKNRKVTEVVADRVEFADSMEYGTPYCVVIEKKILNDGLSSTLLLDIKFKKMEE